MNAVLNDPFELSSSAEASTQSNDTTIADETDTIDLMTECPPSQQVPVNCILLVEGCQNMISNYFNKYTAICNRCTMYWTRNLSLLPIRTIFVHAVISHQTVRSFLCVQNA